MIYILSVLTEHKVFALDTNFTYFSKEIVEIGSRVKINFHNQFLVGFVLNVEECVDLKQKENEYGFKIKEISEIIDKKPIIDENLLKLANQLKERYFYPLIGVLNTMLPPSLKGSSSFINKAKIQYINFYELIDKNYDPVNKYEERILNKFKYNSFILKSELNDSNTLNNLIEKNIIKETKEEKYRFNLNKLFEYKEIKELNDEQEYALNQIITSNERSFLLKGVTGSGKTAIYLKLIEDALNSNKSILILVPEVALTPLMVSQIVSNFNEKVALLHSSLTVGERYDEYRKIKDNLVKIVVGTRSAIFAPISNLKYIIIDEEHDESYKQDFDLTYDAIDVAFLRSNNENAKLILGSATPSIEVMAKAKSGKIKLLELKNKFFNKENVHVDLVDFKNKKAFSYNSPIFSDLLIEKIKNRLKNNEQVILMINKRGYASSIRCEDCGFIFKCPHCNLPLIYHKDNNLLMCHHCDYKIVYKNKCSICDGNHFKKGGFGIEQVTQEFERLFPSIHYLILDSDKTPSLNQIEDVLTKFNSKEVNVLIGTQIVAKGHDFKDVSLVGILNADTLLNIPSYKANELTFSLLTQTIGRSGRFKKGEAVIQTYHIDNKTINFAIKEDYNSFYEYEILNRKKLINPPFSKIISVRIASKNINIAKFKTKEIYNLFTKILKNELIEYSLAQEIYKGYYSFNIFIKTKNFNETKRIISSFLFKYSEDKEYKIYINVSPLNI